MTLCPQCSTPNRPGAKFCKRCATPLPLTAAATRPLELELMSPDNTPNPYATRRLTPPSRSGTRPLPPQKPFERRPPGAVFNEVFVYDNVVFSDERENHYLVHQAEVPEEWQIRFCPNPNCGAVFPPRAEAAEKFCTDCGQVLERGGRDLLLIETPQPPAENIRRLASKGLSHGAVRPPLLYFEERLAGQPRYCLLKPYVGPLEGVSDVQLALQWGIALAQGLDYLHDNGVGFNGRVDEHALGSVGGRAVWANFTHCSHHPEGYVTDRKADAEALARLILRWLSGNERLDAGAGLPAPVYQVFERTFTPPGVASASQLAEWLLQAQAALSTVQNLDYHSGRRTHVGQVRSLNEDSLLALELGRINQSISQPLGLYVVADGMGGHAAGEVASGAIVATIAQKAFRELMTMAQATSERAHWLRQAVEEANRQVYELRRTTGSDMGSTLVAALLEGNKAYIAHVGDSRAYLLNAQGIQRLTVDHSLVERLLATNQITAEQARHHPQRNVIYRTVGDKEHIEVDISEHALKVGDYLLLCSDGLSGMVDDQAIYSIVMSAPSPQAACDALVQAANAAGGDDNISVILVQIAQS